MFQLLKSQNVRIKNLNRLTNSFVVKLQIYIAILLCIMFSSSAFAQKKNAKYELKLKPASSEIRIDGIMDERAWEDADLASKFFMVQPMDTSFAKVRTDVKMSYDKDFLYLIAICYHEPGPYFVESLRRDFAFGKNDNFLLFMDPFDDQTNGFSFGSNIVIDSAIFSLYKGSFNLE